MENDIHTATETYLNQMCRKFHSQNNIVATQKDSSSNKENENTKLEFLDKPN